MKGKMNIKMKAAITVGVLFFLCVAPVSAVEFLNASSGVDFGSDIESLCLSPEDQIVVQSGLDSRLGRNGYLDIDEAFLREVDRGLDMLYIVNSKWFAAVVEGNLTMIALIAKAGQPEIEGVQIAIEPMRVSEAMQPARDEFIKVVRFYSLTLKRYGEGAAEGNEKKLEEGREYLSGATWHLNKFIDILPRTTGDKVEFEVLNYPEGGEASPLGL